MAEDKRLSRYYKALEKVATWQLIIIFIFELIISATFLRLNNIGMIERRSAVYTADEAGDKELVASRLVDLQHYVAGHMNSDPGQIVLENIYNQDYNDALNKASSAQSSNLHKQIDTLCKSRYTSNWTAYFQCFIDQLNASPEGKDITNSAKFPSVAFYTHSYFSPLWTPDFAGLSVLICIFLLALIIIRIISFAVMYSLIRKHRKLI